jgi:hypothetical protein
MGNGCAYDNCEKAYPYMNGGCPVDGNPGQLFVQVQWASTAPECSNISGYSCKTIYTFLVHCSNDSWIWNMEIQACNNNPRDEECTPTGHGEGIAQYEYECSDGINNDCDTKLDCEEDRCHAGGIAFCDQYCDTDTDGVRDGPCNGPDCHPQNPNLPGAMVNGEFVEQNCFDNKDDDCDDKVDCKDSDCRAVPANNCPPLTAENCYDTVDNDYDDAIDCADNDCCEVRSDCPAAFPEVCPTPEPTPTPGGGDPTYSSGQTYCQSYYALTDWYISYDGGNTWSYYYTQWDYIGESCYLIYQ